MMVVVMMMKATSGSEGRQHGESSPKLQRARAKVNCTPLRPCPTSTRPTLPTRPNSIHSTATAHDPSIRHARRTTCIWQDCHFKSYLEFMICSSPDQLWEHGSWS